MKPTLQTQKFKKVGNASMQTAQNLDREKKRELEADEAEKKIRRLKIIGAISAIGLFTPFMPLALLGLGASVTGIGLIAGRYQAGESLDDSVPRAQSTTAAVEEFTLPGHFRERILNSRWRQAPSAAPQHSNPYAPRNG